MDTHLHSVGHLEKAGISMQSIIDVFTRKSYLYGLTILW